VFTWWLSENKDEADLPHVHVGCRVELKVIPLAQTNKIFFLTNPKTPTEDMSVS